MKNSMNITLGNINLVIEGQPVVLENIQLDYENEASVQELAAGASFIKDLIGEIKDMVKEAQASATQYTPAPTTITTAKADVTEPKKTEQHWDLPAIWSIMTRTLPTGFEKTGVGVFTYKHEKEEADGKTKKTTIKISFKDESIDMNVRLADTSAFFYLYEEGERSWVNGINPAIVNELIDELPEDVKEFVGTFVKKVLNK